jgi:hypothetical protein
MEETEAEEKFLEFCGFFTLFQLIVGHVIVGTQQV